MPRGIPKSVSRQTSILDSTIPELKNSDAIRDDLQAQLESIDALRSKVVDMIYATTLMNTETLFHVEQSNWVTFYSNVSVSLNL